MANPKRRASKQRKHKRRTHWKLSAPEFVKCDNCGEMKRPHRICEACGFYNGKKIIAVGE